MAKTKDRIEIYKSRRNGQYGWRRKRGGNNEIVSGSVETYVKHSHALRMAAELNPGIEIVDLTKPKPKRSK